MSHKSYVIQHMPQGDSELRMRENQLLTYILTYVGNSIEYTYVYLILFFLNSNPISTSWFGFEDMTFFPIQRRLETSHETS